MEQYSLGWKLGLLVVLLALFYLIFNLANH